MDNEILLALFDTEQRINIEFPGVRKEQRPHVIRFVSEPKGPHFILYSQLAGADVEAVIVEEKAYFTRLGEVEWKVYAHDHPENLRELLVAQGFEAEEPEAVMVLDLEEIANRGKDTFALQDRPRAGADQNITARAGEVKIRRLGSSSQLEDVRRIEETVWEEDFEWVTERFATDLEVPGYLSVYAAYVDGQPACAGWITSIPTASSPGCGAARLCPSTGDGDPTRQCWRHGFRRRPHEASGF